jgi:predicted nucleotide-binding protein
VARKPTTKSIEPKKSAELTMTRNEAKAKLQDRIEKGVELNRVQVNTPQSYETAKNEYSKWDSFNTELLKRMFTTEELSTEYSGWGVVVVSMGRPSLGEQIAKLNKGIDDKIHRIDSIIERLELFPLSSSLQSESNESNLEAAPPSHSKKVFVVHGHDEVAKTNLEVFLHEIGLEPVVLHRQADEGMTVIEKFEKHSDVGYAFILLTPDEIAYLKADAGKPDGQRKKENRARPNVIFEFGYFVGKLGRARVCCLYTGDVALPSDVHGMIYKKFGNRIDEVAYSIIKDLKASGYAIA